VLPGVGEKLADPEVAVLGGKDAAAGPMPRDFGVSALMGGSLSGYGA